MIYDRLTFPMALSCPVSHPYVPPTRSETRAPIPLNEEETKYHLINPVLQSKGYDDPWKVKLETPAPVEPTGFKGSRRKGPGRTDYLLCVHAAGMPKPLPVAVIEAKAENADPLKGMEQSKQYGECKRFSVRYVFATNGHRYGEFDIGHQRPGGPFRLADFPSHVDLTARYSRDIGLDVSGPDAALLYMADSTAYPKPRYYQDAAIRATFEKVLRCEQAGQPARVLLSLATGSGKTVIAANLLYRLHEAGRLQKPALFLCDRDELREQAYEKLSKAMPKGSVRMVASSRGANAAANAKVHIATYQTLGLDEEESDDTYESFLSRHYSDNFFSVIIIDECHRSAWGRWSEVLRRNPEAIQIGLTATPRKLAEPKSPKNAETRAKVVAQIKTDDDITANNLKHFGEPVYEYGLIQAQDDGYLAACEVVKLKPSVDGKTYTRAEVLKMQPVDARTGQPIPQSELKDEYNARHFDDELMLPERVKAMCGDLFQRLCENGGPEQKVIVFCARDHHADRVAQEMQRLYADWCQRLGKKPKERYAFKCTASGGSDQIKVMRGSGQRCFIACTVDLLATGVDIERLNAVVFFRYLESPILFYQMVGRGTRIHEPTHKYKFWLYDYTGVTELFGTEFISKPTPPRPRGGGDDGPDPPPPPPPPPPLPELEHGEQVHIKDHGRFIVQHRDGKDVLVAVEEYQRGMIERVLREAASLRDFRALWVDAPRRRDLIAHLLGAHYSPDTVRELMLTADHDHYEVFAHFGYGQNPLKRAQREATYLRQQAPWFASVSSKAASVLRGLGHQFGRGGTEALESTELWNVPEIRRAGGLIALGSMGVPADVMREAKMRLFAV